ncbi:MAG: diadenylate cyclase CdaA [Bryobacteraceae bacterium]
MQPFAAIIALPELTLTAVIDILVVAFLIFQGLQIVRGTRAAHILIGIIAFIVVYRVSIWADLELLHSILANVIPYTAIAVIVLFREEIRRTLARIGRRPWLTSGLRQMEASDEIALALTRLSQEKTGALVIMERDTGLRTFIESGIPLDANVSRDLLVAIFQTSQPLHDGAAIVQKDRVCAAGCFLPLSTNPALSSKLGTRHRAAIGITEETDCLALVVSEETGRMSIAANGELEEGVTQERLEDRIAEHFGVTRPAPASSGVRSVEVAPAVKNDSPQAERVYRP